jgi:hypothetical protein
MSQIPMAVRVALGSEVLKRDSDRFVKAAGFCGAEHENSR